MNSAQIADAIGRLPASAFSKTTGKPSVTALSKEVGEKLSAKQRDEAHALWKARDTEPQQDASEPDGGDTPDDEPEPDDFKRINWLRLIRTVDEAHSRSGFKVFGDRALWGEYDCVTRDVLNDWLDGLEPMDKSPAKYVTSLEAAQALRAMFIAATGSQACGVVLGDSAAWLVIVAYDPKGRCFGTLVDPILGKPVTRGGLFSVAQRRALLI